MEVLKCIIIEDEPIAAEIIADYIGAVPFLECLAVFNNPVLALQWLMDHTIDVIFLDINMPGIKGNEFISAVKGDYQYIITTAYQEFAVDSYQWGVVDYLMKPIDFARFMVAVAKLKFVKKDQTQPKFIKEDQRIYQFFNVNKNHVKICIQDILYIESVKDYLKISTGTQSILTKGKLSDLETAYKPYGIIRIHRSFMINLNKMDSFNQNEIFVNGTSFAIGRQYKESVQKYLETLTR
ncbi:MAG: response regulator transcription factor [Saprospiraceae bacterium]|nr:response regulator transcription factor [Saprospiraceae bacterium]